MSWSRSRESDTDKNGSDSGWGDNQDPWGKSASSSKDKDSWGNSGSTGNEIDDGAGGQQDYFEDMTKWVDDSSSSSSSSSSSNSGTRQGTGTGTGVGVYPPPQTQPSLGQQPGGAAVAPQPVKLTGPAYCGVVGVANLIQGAIAGSAIGFFHTMHEAYTLNIMRQPDFPIFLRQGVVRQASNFGGWLAVYGASKCMSTHFRKKDDAMNGFLGGFAAGCVISLQTRNPRTIIAAGLMNGSVMFVMDVITSASKNSH